MADLFEQGVGKKPEQGTEASSEPKTKTSTGTSYHDSLQPGTDLTSSGAKSEKKAEPETETESKEAAKAEGSKEAKGSEKELGETDPSTWTLENSLKEMKKAREEAKTARLKYQEKLKQKEEEFQEKMSSERTKYEDAMKAAKELEEMKLKEADKKRSLEERLAHREKIIADSEARMEAIEKNYRDQLEAADTRIKELEAEREAQNQVYNERLTQELDSIPEDKRDIASYIVKGAGSDPRDQLIALNEARIKGFFDEKKVVVNHSVPNATNGARVSQKQLDEAEAERRSKMSPQDKIREGLKGVVKPNAKMGKNSLI